MAEGEGGGGLSGYQKEIIAHYVAEYIFEIAEYLPKFVKKAYGLGSRQATESLGYDYDEKDYAAQASAYAAGYTKTMADEGGSMIDGELVPWLEDTDEGLREDIAGVLMDSYKNGWTERETEDALRDVWDESDRRIEMVVRTELSRSMYYGELDRYQEEGVEQVEWLTGDMACPDCAELNGQIFDIDKCPEIPYHPNCRCDIAPYTGEGGIRRTGIIKSKTEYHGGAGSGNWGHAGRPGEVGGSAAGGAGYGPKGTRNPTRGRGSATTPQRKIRSALASHAKIKSVVDEATEHDALDIRNAAIARRYGGKLPPKVEEQLKQALEEQGRFGIKGIHLEGATDEELDSIASGLETLEANGVKIAGIGWMTPEEELTYMIQGGMPTALYSVVGNDIRISRDSFKTAAADTKASDERFRAQTAGAEAMLQDEILKGTISDHEALMMTEKLNACSASSRFTAHSLTNPQESAITHEAYHAVMANEGLDERWARVSSNAHNIDKGYSLSGYAGMSNDAAECWAEACTAMTFGLNIPVPWENAVKMTGVTIRKAVA